MSVVYPVWQGNARAYDSGIGKKQAPTPFLYRKQNLKQHIKTTKAGCPEDRKRTDMNSIAELQMMQYRHKRKSALIGVLTLGLAGLALVGIGETWRSNIFRGTSMDRGGLGWVLQILSFVLLTVALAIPFFIVSFVQLLYYQLKLSNVS